MKDSNSQGKNITQGINIANSAGASYQKEEIEGENYNARRVSFSIETEDLIALFAGTGE